jgi:peptidase E
MTLSAKGTMVLMGSGELTATMVEVHKELLASFHGAPRAVFLDTPAGFQLNVDRISEKAVDYFQNRVLKPLQVASYKSDRLTTTFEAEKAFHTMRQADYILIGPGSPTYAVRHLQQTPVPDILVRRVQEGGCLVAASAAALTVGRFTLPVYEIYKVGEDLHWEAGMDLLGRLGFNLVVVPHWNNAEGGNHDTRFCFMGEPRFMALEALLPDDVAVLGLDEHTACIMDLEKDEAVVKGIGRICLRHRGKETVFTKGQRFPLDVLRGAPNGRRWKPPAAASVTSSTGNRSVGAEDFFWPRIHALEADFRSGLESRDAARAANALLELDRVVWGAQAELVSAEDVSQAREVLRDLLALQGMALDTAAGDSVDPLAPLVEELLDLRETFRRQSQWSAADAIRDALQRGGIVVEDTPAGTRWRPQTD